VSKRGRVTILGLNYAPEPTGNAPYTTALARHLQATGFTTTVLTAFPHYPQWRRYDGYRGWRSETIDEGVRLIRLKHWVPYPPRGVRRLVSEISFGIRLVLSRWHRPGTVVLVSPALFSTFLAMLRLTVQRRPRRIVWVQDLYSQGMEETGEGGGLAQQVARMVERWTLRRAHTVIAIHEVMAMRMIESLGVDRDRIEVIPNWTHVTPSGLSPTDAKKHLGWPPVFTALHAGNMGLKQGLEVIVSAAREAAEREPSLRFVLLGDGGERARLEELAADISAIAFIDPLGDSDFSVALAAADVLLVTEALGVAEMAAPSKLTSYFAANRPVVASVSADGIVARMMLEAGAGIVTAGGDSESLLAAVEELRENPDHRESYSQRARDYWLHNLGPDPALAAWARILQPSILGEA